MTVFAFRGFTRPRLEVFHEVGRHPIHGEVAPPRVAEQLGFAGVTVLAPDVALPPRGCHPFVEARHELAGHPIGDLLVVGVGRVVRLQVTVLARDA
jgi:hypothetical protein